MFNYLQNGSVMILLACFCVMGCSNGKGLFSKNYPTREVIVNGDSTVTEVHVLRANPDVKVKLNAMYHWYAAKKVHKARGGYEGLLLHGPYTKFFPDNDLFKQGEYHLGCKEGLWKTWYPDGQLKKVQAWKNGRRNGVVKRYNDSGILIKEGSYKNGQLHGKQYTYNDQGDLVRKVKYKKGEIKKKYFDKTNSSGTTEEKEEEQEQKPGFFKRIFKKSDKEEKKD